MGKNKLKRFAEVKALPNTIEPTRDEVLNNFYLKGKWAKEHFKNDKPIVLELGCGKGEYTVGLAERFPDKNFIGIDVKGARLWRGAKTANENGMDNVAFMRTQVELIEYLFAENEVSEIWITFPDPQIKYRRTKHRLTEPGFLKKYQHILNDEGIVHLKTDSEFLHGYTLGIIQGEGHEILEANHDIYNTYQGDDDSLLTIQTHYESIFLKEKKAITYIKFKIRY